MLRDVTSPRAQVQGEREGPGGQAGHALTPRSPQPRSERAPSRRAARPTWGCPAACRPPCRRPVGTAGCGSAAPGARCHHPHPRPYPGLHPTSSRRYSHCARCACTAAQFFCFLFSRRSKGLSTPGGVAAGREEAAAAAAAAGGGAQNRRRPPPHLTAPGRHRQPAAAMMRAAHPPPPPPAPPLLEHAPRRHFAALAASGLSHRGRRSREGQRVVR